LLSLEIAPTGHLARRPPLSFTLGHGTSTPAANPRGQQQMNSGRNSPINPQGESLTVESGGLALSTASLTNGSRCRNIFSLAWQLRSAGHGSAAGKLNIVTVKIRSFFQRHFMRPHLRAVVKWPSHGEHVAQQLIISESRTPRGKVSHSG
jgi:hypothetical protein